MNDLGRRLREAPLPGEAAARERARMTVLAAHAAAPHRARVRPARAVLAAVLLVALGALTAPGQAVATWLGVDGPARAVKRLVSDVVGPSATPRRAPAALPAPGRLLVAGPRGAWIVDRDGARRRLGAWTAGTWSPGGVYVALVAGRSLAAVDPQGRVRWRLELGARVSTPRWAPDGTHVAYRAGRALRVVYGNGAHDRLVAPVTAPVAPAWRPTAPHTLAWAGADGRVRIADADTGRLLRLIRARDVSQIAWSADGQRLLVAVPAGGRVHDLATGRSSRLRLRSGRTKLTAAAFSPKGDRLALAVRLPSGSSELRLLGRAQPLLAAPGRLSDLTWSPDGRWLLAAWPAARQWLLVRTAGRPRVLAVAGLTHRYGPAARPQAWCCGRAKPG